MSPSPLVSSQSAVPEETKQPSEEEAAAFEQKYVHTVYSEIAPHFAATRHTAWPQVVDFLSELADHSIVADVGCGNGKYLLTLNRQKRAVHMIGVDSCAELCELASRAVSNCSAPSGENIGGREEGTLIERQRSLFDFAVGDALELPFRSGVFDAAISIAVAHHLSTRTRRIAAHESLGRLLRPGGRGLIYVWAQERPDANSVVRRGRSKMMARRFEAADMLIPWHMRTRKEGATDERILGDWHEVHRRFYHVYADGELEAELSQVSTLLVKRIYYDHQNWCAVVEKVVSE